VPFYLNESHCDAYTPLVFSLLLGDRDSVLYEAAVDGIYQATATPPPVPALSVAGRVGLVLAMLAAAAISARSTG
jgi:hypothetical protein